MICQCLNMYNLTSNNKILPTITTRDMLLFTLLKIVVYTCAIIIPILTVLSFVQSYWDMATHTKVRDARVQGSIYNNGPDPVYSDKYYWLDGKTYIY